MKKKVKKIIRKLTNSVDLIDRIDLIKSRFFVDIQSCESVCLALGPYRNLTTLTAATLFLHPNCQVLNHASSRIYGKRQIDFLSNYSDERFNRFIQFAIEISSKGQKGDLGGSITYSHAFYSKYKMMEVYQKNNLGLLKNQIKCLFWKESLRTSNLIREKQIDLGNIFDKDDRLRFLLPIRNPLDCAISNLRTGHANIFRGLNKDSSIFEVLQAIIDEIHWFATYKKHFPSRFFYYFEYEISPEMLIDLATFLNLDPNETWLLNAQSVMKPNSSYEHDSKLLVFYQETVKDKFSCFPSLSEKLLRFT